MWRRSSRAAPDALHGLHRFSTCSQLSAAPDRRTTGDSMPDQLEVLKRTAAHLDALGIHYMLTGSVAAGWYSQPRMTRDIDLVAVLYPPHADQLATAMADEFECDAEAMRAAIAGR